MSWKTLTLIPTGFVIQTALTSQAARWFVTTLTDNSPGSFRETAALTSPGDDRVERRNSP